MLVVPKLRSKENYQFIGIYTVKGYIHMLWLLVSVIIDKPWVYTHTHTHIYKYINICVCVSVCVCVCVIMEYATYLWLLDIRSILDEPWECIYMIMEYVTHLWLLE